MKNKKTVLFLGAICSALILLGCNSNVSSEPEEEKILQIADFAVSEKGMKQASFTWPNGKAVYDSYEIVLNEKVYKINAGNSETSEDSVSIRITQLKPDCKYKAVLNGYKNESLKGTAELTFTTVKKGPAENIAAEVNNETIILSWTSLYGTDITSLEIYRKSETEDYELIHTEESLNTNDSFTDETAVQETNYTYIVKTYSGEESWTSEEVSVLADYDNLDFKVTDTGMFCSSFEWNNDGRFDKYRLNIIRRNISVIISSSDQTEEKITYKCTGLPAGLKQQSRKIDKQKIHDKRLRSC